MATIVAITGRRAGIYYESYSYTRTQSHTHPFSTMNNTTHVVKTRQLCTQWWELDRVE